MRVPLAVTNVQMPEWQTETHCDGFFVCLMVLMLLPAPASAVVIVHFL